MTADNNERWASGLALITTHESGQILDAWYPKATLGKTPLPVPELEKLVKVDSLRKVETSIVEIVINLDAAPKSVADAYLRLHLLSLRLAPPRSLNLEGIFGILNNVVWTSAGPCAITDFTAVQFALKQKYGQLTVYGVDKFPRMVDYVLPDGVRIADADRVRLGAYLAPGTTVMHEGFVNFNAGTLGASMVEGRISAGVIVDDGSDIGGGASIMGTLSGGGKEQIRIGKRCLLGAESGIGISLGNDCIVEAGLYLTAGTKVTLPDGEIVKAGSISGADNLLFLRDSQSGRVIAKKLGNQEVELNSELHKN